MNVAVPFVLPSSKWVRGQVNGYVTWGQAIQYTSKYEEFRVLSTLHPDERPSNTAAGRVFTFEDMNCAVSPVEQREIE